MIAILSKKITCWSAKYQIIDRQEEAIIRYGLTLMMECLLQIIGFLILGILTGKFMLVIVFIMAFGGLRIYAGGFHLRTAWGCTLAMAIMCFSVIFVSERVSFDRGSETLVYLICLLMLALLAPGFTANNPITSKSIIKRNKIITMFYFTIIYFIAAMSGQVFANIVLLSTLLEVATLIPLKIERR